LANKSDVLKLLKETMNNVPGQPVFHEKSEPGTSKIWSGNADLYNVTSL